MSTPKNHDFRERRLSRRQKKVDVFLLPSGKQFRVIAEMQDSVHHMRITVVIDQPSLIIRKIDCEMIAVPDELCRDALTFFDPLIGKRVAGGVMRNLKISKNQGCTHLVDLFRDACYSIPLAQSQLGEEQLTALFPGITDEQLYNIFLWFKPDLENSCIRYASDSPFMSKLNNTPMPDGAEKLRATIKSR